MKSFNEFVSIKESDNGWNRRLYDNQTAAMKSDILKMVQKINLMLGAPNMNAPKDEIQSVMEIKRIITNIELAMNSAVEGGMAAGMAKYYGDPLESIEKIARILQQEPSTSRSRRLSDIRMLVGDVSIKIAGLPEYSKLNSDIQQKISKFPPPPPAKPNYNYRKAPPPPPAKPNYNY